MDFSKRTHAFKKGETPAKIAKKWQHKSFDTIWNHKNNKSLKSKRKKPESLASGDRIYIPLTDALRKQALAEYELLHEEWADEGLAYAKLAELQMNLQAHLGNLTTGRMLMNGGLQETEAVLMRLLKDLRAKQPPADQIKRMLNKVAKQTALAMKEANDLAASAETGAKAVLQNVDPAFKKLLGGKSTPAAEATKAMSHVTEAVDGIFGAVASIGKELKSATSSSYWVDKIFLKDVEYLDVGTAMDKQEKQLMKAVNTVRKMRAVSDKLYGGMITVTSARLKRLEKSIPEAKKRYQAAEKRAKALPKPSVILAA